MAATIFNVVKDTPHSKIFYVNSPEADPINQNDALTFAGGGMGDFASVPGTIWWQEVTEAGDTPTVKGKIAIHTVTAAGFSVFKPSIAAATAFNHRYRVWMSTKRALEL